MSINTYPKNKISQQAEQKQNYKYRKRFDGYQMGGVSGEWAKRVQG